MRILKYTTLAILAGGILLIGGCSEPESAGEHHEVPRNVRVLTVAAGSVQEYFEVSGPVVPVRGTDLSAEENGAISALNLAKGANVRRGEVIVSQDRTILGAEHEAAAAQLATQAYNIDKVRQLHEAGKVSRIELLAAEAEYAASRAAAGIAAERFDRAAVRAPYDGLVADRYVELGQLVTVGMPVVRVIDPYTLKLEAYLTEEQVPWAKPGQSASVLLAGGTEPVAGAVAWVGFEADRQTGKFKLDIEIPNPDLTLRSGVIGRARLEKNTVEGAIVIPRDAVLDGRTGPAAYVVEQERAVLRPLSLGSSQGLMVEVRAGLQLGDRLVVRGQRDLREGGLVRVTEQAEAADGTMAGDPAGLGGAAAGTRLGDAAEGEAVR